jgi:chaperone modulatory protein CbpM
MSDAREINAVVMLDRSIHFTLEDFCRACGARRALVVEMMEFGIIEPALKPQGEASVDKPPVFHGEALVRAQVATRLMRDLGVNIQGAALAIELLEQLDRL